jgi:hypothetical protein
MIRYFRTLWRPGLYHGSGVHNIFFEGWYYKFVDPSHKNKIIIIPGIYQNKKKDEYFAFIQLMDAQSYDVSFHRFEIENCQFSKNSLKIKMGNNLFTQNHIQLNLHSNKRSISGEIRFKKLTPWPVHFLSPGAMGWYGFIPFMQCYHAVLSFDHKLNGELYLNNQYYSFHNGRGYIEKDWGNNFPSAYIWLQSNHFEGREISIFATVANIPWMRGSFRGFLIGIYLDHKLYQFTTYGKSALEHVHIHKDNISIHVERKNFRLEINASRGSGGWLYGPSNDSFTLNVFESLESRIAVRLIHYQKKQAKVLYEGVSLHGALEVHGNLDQIADINS